MPHLSEIEDVILVVITFFLGDELNIPGPGWEVSSGNVSE
jgi:hypothetical protein